MEKNPFEILGLCPAAIRGLTDEQIDLVVRAAYRSQSQVRHVDKGGSEAESRSVNEASVQLDRASNPTEFEYWKTMFLIPQGKKAQEREKDQRVAEAFRTVLERRLLDFWKARAGYSEEGFVSAERLPAFRMVMNDRMRGALSHKLGALSSTEMPDQMYELERTADGTLTRYQLASAYTKNEQVPADTPPGWINKTRHSDNRDWFWKRVGDPIDMSHVSILGGIIEQTTSSAFITQNLNKLLPTDRNATYEDIEKGFDIEYLRWFMPFMSPYFRMSSTLFGLLKNREAPMFTVLGSVTRIHVI